MLDPRPDAYGSYMVTNSSFSIGTDAVLAFGSPAFDKPCELREVGVSGKTRWKSGLPGVKASFMGDAHLAASETLVVVATLKFVAAVSRR
ncbi:MAG: hypothetical protein ACI9OJ_002279 [Myxococcota bacterium]|jgi:hypothetical protein